MNGLPKIIAQVGRPPYAAAMIDDCAANLRLSGAEHRLLRFYGGCGSGFAPALAKISGDTGLAVNKISEIRARLLNRGLLKSGGEVLAPDWFRIRAFAMMDRQSKRAALRATYIPVKDDRVTLEQLAKSRPSDRDAWPRNELTEQRKLSEAEEHFLWAISGMTEKEYLDFLSFDLPAPKIFDHFWGT